VQDCQHRISSYFVDSSQECLIADRLAEDVIHHASVLSQCSYANADLHLLDDSNFNQLQFSSTMAAVTLSGAWPTLHT